MQEQNLNFRPLYREDIPLLHRWLSEPHVKEWYADDDDFDAILEGRDPTKAFIICVDEKPIGYIQTYLIKDNPEYAIALDLGESGQDEENSAGMDLFIGDPEFIHKGLGSEIIKKFLKEIIFADPAVKSCIIGPEPKNTGAIRAYEKSGFKYLKTVNISGEKEPEYLMKIGRP